MYSKPLTYDSLKTVLQHLDANTRFLISIRIPSVQVAERTVPLKIENLCFRDMQFEVNETCYSLNVRFEGPDVPFSPSFNRDVDEYGETDKISRRTVLPGDVVFKPLDPHPIPPVPPVMTEKEMNEEIREYERKLQNEWERRDFLEYMAQDNFVGTLDNCNRDHLNCFLSGNNAQIRALENNPEVEQARRVAVAVTEHVIKEYGRSLQPLLNRRDNVRPNFEIKLKITSPSGVRTERVKYTGKLHLAEKSILKMMFGNRKHAVQVRKLTISENLPIRFPLGLKMKIREFFPIGNIKMFVSALNPVVDSSSYPLERIGVGYEDGQDMEHEVVQSAKILTLFFRSRDTPMLPVLLNLQNKKVQAVALDAMKTEEHVMLIKSWLEMGKSNGTCYTFPMLNEQGGKEILEMVEQQCHGAVMEDKCVVIPMNVSSKLKLSNEDNNLLWVFRMKVLPCESC